MVFYYLTPAQFGRYSKANLCPALSSLGRSRNWRTGGGIWLVNPSYEGCFPTFVAALRAGLEPGRPSAASEGETGLSARLEAVLFQSSASLVTQSSTRSTSCSN